MAKKGFSANSWLGKLNKETALEEALCTSVTNSYTLERADQSHLPPLPMESSAFRPDRYFIPGWSGGSLFSKSALSIKKLQEKLWEDAKQCFKAHENFPRSLSLAIHNEFVSYLRSLKVKDELDELKKGDVFWRELKNPHSLFVKELDTFCDLYSFRVATNFLLRLKFLITYSHAIQFEYNENHLINPTSFTHQLFRKGSQSEISCEAFKINQYTWYRPTHNLISSIEKSIPYFKDLSIAQIMKINSFRSAERDPSLLSFEDKDYSHALSHRSFGRLINELLIFFPQWKEYENFSYPRKNYILKPEVLSTLFTGDNVESLSQSHWLAQESNLNQAWSEVLCPEFTSNDQAAECFVRLAQELQFLTFLVNFAHDKNLNVKELLSRITKEKYRKQKDQGAGQFNLFNSRELAYDRIVLNIGKLPKKNPHHFLINKINSQKEKLLDNGHLIVLTNQKLFVPSQSKKVATLLRDFKVECLFNFEKLKGKGEVANYLYILKKRTASTLNLLNLTPNSQDNILQEPCLTFRTSGTLSQFSHFESLVTGLYDFFKTKSSFSTSMYHKILEHKLTLEFHQDAIVEGKLLSSLTGEKDQVTHPRFFKNLTVNCVPFETYFHIDDLDAPNRLDLKRRLLGSADQSPRNGSHQILIVDHRENLYPQVEICPSSAYSAKRQEYGEAYFSYYAITQKISNFNHNLLRAFFDCPLGQQIVQICLRGGPSKLKGRLRSLLVPRFFGEGINIEQSQFKESKLLSITAHSFLESDPSAINNLVKEELKELSLLKSQSVWAYLSLLVHVDMGLKRFKETNSETEIKGVDFQNPLILKSLGELETTCIYPNEEIYTELLIESKEDLDKPFSEARFSQDKENCLDIYAQSSLLIQFYGEKELLKFIEFILSQAKGQSLLSLLQNLYIPKASDLKALFSQLENSRSHMDEIEGLIQNLIKEEFTKQLTQV